MEHSTCRTSPLGERSGPLRTWRWAAVGLMLIATAPAAWATGSASISNTEFPVLRVVGDGTKYTALSSGVAGYGWEARVRIEAKPLTRIKDWQAYPVVGNTVLPLVERVYPFGTGRPKNVDGTVGKVFPANVVKDYAVARCNANAAALKQAGQSDEDIFGQDRTLDAQISFILQVNLSMQGSDSVSDLSDHASHPTQIVCERALVSKPVVPFELEGAELVVMPSKYQGKCPKDLNLIMKVEANQNAPFVARIESTDGWKSKPMNLKTSQPKGGQTEMWKREFVEPFGVPYDRPGSGGVGGQAVGGGFASPKRPDDFPQHGGGRPATVGGFKGNAPDNMHQASLRLVATAHGQTVMSGWKNYSVTCTPQTRFDGPGSVAGPRSPVAGSADSRPGARPAAGAAVRTPPRPASPPARPTASTPSPSRPKPAAPGRRGQPDLVIRSVRRAAGHLRVQVANEGTADAPATRLKLSYRRAGKPDTRNVRVPPIASRRTAWVRVEVPARALKAAQQVVLHVDDANRVSESNEGNNRHKVK